VNAGSRPCAGEIPASDRAIRVVENARPTAILRAEEPLMAEPRELTAIIEREGDGYVALCPELDIASQGDSVEGARANLAEAVELFFETADPSEVERRLHTEVYMTRLNVARG